ncbi:MAG: hypothetical protein JWN56_2830 [Sphingobacteriales bacterium]|nr:hypothetical protein [Sphingobacteriales bacterium]
MKSKYLIVVLLLILVTVSFCTQKNKKEAISATPNKTVKAGTSKPKCCSSNTPARFPLKNSNIPQPTINN